MSNCLVLCLGGGKNVFDDDYVSPTPQLSNHISLGITEQHESTLINAWQREMLTKMCIFGRSNYGYS